MISQLLDLGESGHEKPEVYNEHVRLLLVAKNKLGY